MESFRIGKRIYRIVTGDMNHEELEKKALKGYTNRCKKCGRRVTLHLMASVRIDGVTVNVGQWDGRRDRCLRTYQTFERFLEHDKNSLMTKIVSMVESMETDERR